MQRIGRAKTVWFGQFPILPRSEQALRVKQLEYPAVEQVQDPSKPRDCHAGERQHRLAIPNLLLAQGS
jgi:hypothetical protein